MGGATSDPAPLVRTPLPPGGRLPRLPPGGLTRFFDPFLAHFASETLRGGGEVDVYQGNGSLEAVTLRHPSLHLVSLLARSPAVGASIFRELGAFDVFAEYPLGQPIERFLIFSGPVDPSAGERPFRHLVRPARDADLPEVERIVREEVGPGEEGWLRSRPPANERGFVAEVGGRVAGVAWVSVVGSAARLHSLLVRPAYRRIGVGTDLLRARLGWAAGAGARTVLSEIAEGNGASRRLAEREGLRPVGEIFLHPRATRPGSAVVPGPSI